MNIDGRAYVAMTHLMALEFKARGLSFLARQGRSSLLAGSRASRLRGRGLNFNQLRRYQPGDDLRHLDWRASLRTGKPVVRTFHEERDRPTLIVIDQRMNMFFGSQRSFKSAVAAELGALAAWMVFNAGDRVGGLVFNDRRIDSLAPLRSRHRIQALCSRIVQHIQALNAANPDTDGDNQLDKVLQQCLALAGHDYLICLVSDFAGAGERTVQLLRQLAVHNDVIAMQVYDPLALSLPQNGRVLVSQGQLQLELAVGRRLVRQPLSDFFSARLEGVASVLRRSHVPLMMFSTGVETQAQLRVELGKLVGGATMTSHVPSIEQLKNIALPAPVSYAPQAWGWGGLLILLVGMGLWVGGRRYSQWRRDRYRREALGCLAHLQRRSETLDGLDALRELPELLKRVALSMSATHSQAPAALGHQDWQAFLQHHITPPLPADFSAQLERLAYAPEAALTALNHEHRQQLFLLCKHWVEHHRVAI